MTSDSGQPLPPGKLPGDLLDRLIETYRTPPDPSVMVEASYGFDAAAISVGGEPLVVKSDPITFATEEAAHYLVAVNANDIACMGATPRWMTVVGLLPEGGTTRESVERMFAELQQACTAANVSLVGGHTEITIGLDRPLLIGTMLGLSGDDGLLHPGKASIGDELWLTKYAGLEGTAILANERRDELAALIGERGISIAAGLIHDPGISVVRDAQVALSTQQVTALHDPTEGGVATAIHEIAEASSLGATVDRSVIPVRDDTRAICGYLGIDPLGLISSGALLMAAKPGAGETLTNAFDGTGIQLTRIGEMVHRDHGFTMREGDDISPLPRYDSDELTRVL